MLSDTAYTSPWSSEVLITGDCKLPLFDNEIEDFLSNSNSSCSEGESGPGLDSFSGLSYMTAGSECSSEDLFAEDGDSVFFSQSQLIDTGVNNDLDLSIPDNKDVVGSSSWEVPQGDSFCGQIPPTSIPTASQAFTCTTISPSLTHKSQRSKHMASKPWSHMSKGERLKVIDEISAIISSELGLREQLEVIRIINPAANVNTIDTEFVIDLDAITDTKLHQIEDIVNFHCSQSSDVTQPPHQLHNPDTKFTKRNKAQDRRPSGKVPRHRIQKDIRQKLKEKRSGLFIKEERLAVSTSDIEEDIDILG